MKIKELLKDLRLCQAKLKDEQSNFIRITKNFNENQYIFFKIEKKPQDQQEKNSDFKQLKQLNDKKLMPNFKNLKNSICSIREEIDSLKFHVKTSLNTSSIEAIFEKMNFLIRNTEDLGKLKNEYLKEIQEKKQF